jgi:hypothetical protein
MPELDEHAADRFVRLPTRGALRGYAQDHCELVTIETFGGDGRGCADEFLQDEEKILAG